MRDGAEGDQSYHHGDSIAEEFRGYLRLRTTLLRDAVDHAVGEERSEEQK